MASGERIKSLFEQYVKALETLDEALNIVQNAENPNEAMIKLARDGAIQRFEYTYDLCWKLIKHIAEFKGYRCNSPRDAFKAGFKVEIIKEGFEEIFLDMIEKRNLTTHTYNENTVIEIYEFIKNKAFPAFQSLKIQSEIYC